MNINLKTIGLCVAVLAICATSIAAEVTSPEMTKPATTVTAPKFEQFDPATYKGPAGTVVMPGSGEAMLYLRKIENGKPGDYMIVNAKSATIKLPIGKYNLEYYAMKVTDKEGKAWSIIGTTADPAKPISLDVRLAKTIKMKLGAPLTASIKVTQKDDKTVNMNFVMLGSGGDKCLVSPVGGPVEPPGFKVLSGASAVVMSGKFQFG
jgi:hypothetical protein